MAVQHIHTYLVHPKKGSDEPTRINGTTVQLEGKLFELLNNIYVRSDHECDIDITFSPSDEGAQQNACRTLICSYLTNPSFESGIPIARRLEQHTDGRSGLGLLFLIAGTEDTHQKIVISRFPTDHAIYVDDDPHQLTVQFLERVFMKNKASYKAVSYRDSSLRGGFWSGRAIDKQLNRPTGEQSDYWIVDFLASKFTVTAAQGTRRLAIALRSAAKKSDLNVKQEISAAATLAAGLAGQRLCINDFTERFGLSRAARIAIANEVKNPQMTQERFEFDLNEFRSLIAFKAVELNNGATLSAPSSTFDDVFRQEIVDADKKEVRFTTEGSVTDEKLKSNA